MIKTIIVGIGIIQKKNILTNFGKNILESIKRYKNLKG